MTNKNRVFCSYIIDEHNKFEGFLFGKDYEKIEHKLNILNSDGRGLRQYGIKFKI